MGVGHGDGDNTASFLPANYLNLPFQYKETISETNWNELPPDIIASGSSAGTTDPVGSVAQRFYRVVLVP